MAALTACQTTSPASSSGIDEAVEITRDEACLTLRPTPIRRAAYDLLGAEAESNRPDRHLFAEVQKALTDTAAAWVALCQ